MIPDPPQPHATVEAFGLLQAGTRGLKWVWLPTDRSTTAGASSKLVSKGGRGKSCHVGEQKK